MSSAASPFLSESHLSRQFDLSRSLEQIDRCNDDGELRNCSSTSHGVIEHANVSVTGALGRDVADEKFWHAIEIRFAHIRFPMCNETNDCTFREKHSTNSGLHCHNLFRVVSFTRGTKNRTAAGRWSMKTSEQEAVQ